MTSNNVTDLNIVRTVRELDSLRLVNIAWYCHNYPEKIEKTVHRTLIWVVNSELLRREQNGVNLYEDLVI